MSDLVSIIIRTKNEERWITSCLEAIASQDYKNWEVILVDNESTDKTMEKVSQFKIRKKIIIKQYKPGNALNAGIRESRGKYIVCVSAHCIPTSSRWLSNLLKGFDDPKVAGVYGRQEPMSFTTAADKRDLAVVFGLDRKVQRKDSFFHNANSMIRRDLWKKVPFDDDISNIEDRVWAKKMLEMDYTILYEPDASVYHYHGIHQNAHGKESQERCANVVRILENLDTYSQKSLDLEKMNVVAFLPVKGPLWELNGEPLLFYTIQRARESKFINKIIVSTDSQEIADTAMKMGAEVPFIREALFSKDYVDILKVLQYTIQRTENSGIYPDVVVSLEPTFPFRKSSLLDQMLLQFAQKGFDSVVAARRENRAIWKEKNQTIIELDEGITPRHLKDPTYIELRGVGCVTYPQFLREGRLLGQKVGIYEVNDPYTHLEVRGEEDLKMASLLMKGWSKA